MATPLTNTMRPEDGLLASHKVMSREDRQILALQDQVAELRRALTAAQRPVITVNGDGEVSEVTWGGETWQPKTSAPALRKALETAKSSLTASDKDAARYRWLREGNDFRDTEASRIVANEWGKDWDAAIDAAMEKANG